MKLQTLQTLRFFYRMQDHGRWCVGAHIQAFTFSSQDHGRLSIERISKHSPFSRRRHSQVHGRLSIVRVSEHSLFRLKMTVGCLTSTYPSIHVETLKITVGCPPCTYPSIHPSPGAGTLKITVGCLTSTYPRNKNLQTRWTPWSTQETRGLWVCPPVLSPLPVPVQATHSRACSKLSTPPS